MMRLVHGFALAILAALPLRAEEALQALPRPVVTEILANWLWSLNRLSGARPRRLMGGFEPMPP